MKGDASAEFHDAVRDLFRGVYTVQFAIVVEEPDPTTRRVTVAHQDDPEVLIDNVPVASQYTGDGYGETYPIHLGDRGILLYSKDPIDAYLTTAEFIEDGVPKQRQHSVNDAIFFPQVWSDDQAVPATPDGHDPEEWLMYHETGTYERIRGPVGNGDWEVVHNNGHRLTLSHLEGIYALHALGHEFYMRDTELLWSLAGGPKVRVVPAEVVVEGDLRITGNLTVGGSITAGGAISGGGEITDGFGNSVSGAQATAARAESKADTAQTKNTSQDTTLSDHETRITALEGSTTV